MKKIVVALCILTFGSIYSQDKGYIALTIGASSPMGAFSSKNTNDDSSGLALTGAVVDLSMGYKLSKTLGVAFMIQKQANQLDGQVFIDNIKQNNPTFSGTVATTSWIANSILVGGYGSFPIAKKISLESRALVGMAYASSPELSINLTDTNGNNAWFQKSSSNGSSFAYVVGVGLKYDLWKKFCLLAHVDYHNTKPTFKDTITTNSGPLNSNSYSVTFQTINYGLGIGYRL
jgi:hypothetical protein